MSDEPSSNAPGANYGVLAEVRDRLNLDSDNVEWNNKIGRALNMADNWLNMKLSPYMPVPVASPPHIFADIANDVAAAIVMEETGGNPTGDNEGAMNPKELRERAHRTLNDYIRTTFGVDPEADIRKGNVMGQVHVALSPYMTDEISAEWSD